MIRSLWKWLWGYVAVSYSKLVWILLFCYVFWLIYGVLQKKGYMKFKKKSAESVLCRSMLSLSSSFIFVMTLFGRSRGDYGFEVAPFQSYFVGFGEKNVEVALQILMNIVMYIPIGFLLPCCFQLMKGHRYVLLMAIISSVSIELIQIIFQIGLFEVDDIINNTTGALIGLGFYILWVKVKKYLLGDREI